MQATAQSIYHEIVRLLHLTERLRLAAIIIASDDETDADATYLRQIMPVGKSVPLQFTDTAYEAAASLQSLLAAEAAGSSE